MVAAQPAVTGVYLSGQMLQLKAEEPAHHSIQPGSAELEVVPPEVSIHSCGTPSRKGNVRADCVSQRDSSNWRLCKELSKRETGTILNRSICLKNKHTTYSILQLETALTGSDSGYPFDFVEQSSSTPVSSIHFDQQMSQKDKQGKNRKGKW